MRIVGCGIRVVSVMANAAPPGSDVSCRRSSLKAIMGKLLGVVALIALSGCGGGAARTAHLAGAVTIDGEPVPDDADATVSFSPVDGGQAVSVAIVNGRYDSPDTPQGSVVAKFYISRPVGPVKTSERTGEQYRDIENMVPPEAAAGVTLEVDGDDTSRDFDL